jgi:DNA helicase-2/ATP-dependent DNA helicase PcrA
MQYNSSQFQAISHNKGPMMVLAGPGSGKTFVITERIHYLIEKHHVNPSEILVITFTKAAAKEMENRFRKKSDGKIHPVSFGTFHSFFFKILKYAYNYKADSIIREEERQIILKEILEKMEKKVMMKKNL